MSKMVKELILDRDRVTLPGVGTFVAEMTPASFSDRGYTINPPYRRLFFRHQTGGDRSLIELYASANNVGEDAAECILTDFLSEMKEVLKSRKLIVFPGLGRLRATRENNFFFVADENLDIYPEGFCLESISLKTHQETKEELSAAVEELKTMLVSDSVSTESVSGPVVKQVVRDEVDYEKCEVAGEEKEEEEEEEEDLVVSSEEAATEKTEEVAPLDVVAVADDEVKKGETEGGAETMPEIGTRRKVLIWIASAVAVIVVFLVVYVLLTRLEPGLMDKLLYDSEQLEVLRYWK